MQRAAALIGDTEREPRDALAALLSAIPCDVAVYPSIAELLQHVTVARCRLIVLGGTAAETQGLVDVIRRIRARDSEVPLIVVMRGGSEATAVAALRAGVNDYFGDPFDAVAFSDSARRLLSSRPAAQFRPGRCTASAAMLLGNSQEMCRIRAALERVAVAESTLLITGETGTGKELAARQVHEASSRRNGRFVSVNCAAIPDTLFESELFGHERGAFTGAAGAHAGLLQQAHGGTVFLDEVGDMSLLAQAKVLRALETREVVPLGGRASVPLNLRVVAATNQELDQAVSEGRFRKDLYFRLNVVRINLPPLRERQSDVPMLLAHYANHFSRRLGTLPIAFTDVAIASLKRYGWPGNVRELKNLVEALSASRGGGQIDVDDLPRPIAEAALTANSEMERQHLLSVLLETRWNKSRAARQLRCSRMTLYRRMMRLGLHTDH